MAKLTPEGREWLKAAIDVERRRRATQPGVEGATRQIDQREVPVRPLQIIVGWLPPLAEACPEAAYEISEPRPIPDRVVARRLGIPVPGQAPRISEAQIDAAYEAYREGASLREIATIHWQEWGYTNPDSARSTLGKKFSARGYPRRSISDGMAAKWQRRHLEHTTFVAVAA